MSCNYADGLSPYENKGILGLPEKFDNDEKLEEKCKTLVALMKQSKHVVVHTGAGISTSAGIPDFRGPNGVWTLECKGKKPACNISFNDAKPTCTHMALLALIEHGYIHYIVSQNIDGLHLKSGLKRSYLAELHGNIFLETCQKCRSQFIRDSAVETVGQKPCGGKCRAGRNRTCRGGILVDNVLDWEDDLPELDLEMAVMHSTLADLNITLGTTLQIIPSGNLPLKNKRQGGKLVICNLQPTKHDTKADLIISAYVDDILCKVCKLLGIEIPEYNVGNDPTKFVVKEQNFIEWILPLTVVKEIEKKYNNKQKEMAVKRKSDRLNRTKLSSPAKISKSRGRPKKNNIKKEQN